MESSRGAETARLDKVGFDDYLPSVPTLIPTAASPNQILDEMSEDRATQLVYLE